MMKEEAFLRSLGVWDCKQNNPHHIYTVGEHTEVAVAWCITHGASDELLRATWLHDIGKVKTKVVRKKRGVWIDTFYGHPEVSAQMVKQLGESRYVIDLIRYHDVTIQVPSDDTVFLLAKKGRQWCSDLLLLMQADQAAQHPTYQAEMKATAKDLFAQRLYACLDAIEATTEQA